MRIAYLCTDPGVPVHGTKGAAIHVRELTRALLGLGHEVAVWALRAGGRAPAGYHVPVHTWPGWARRQADGVERELALLQDVRRFRRWFGDEMAGYRPHVIYERYSLYGTAGLGAARSYDVGLILEVNAPLSQEHARHRGLALPGAADAVERHVLTGADRLVAVSDAVAEWLAARGVAPGRVTVLANGVDVARFATADGSALRTQHGLDGSPTVGFVGSLKAWHGTADLVRAVARLRSAGRPVRLVVVGDGPERPALNQLAHDLGLGEALVFAGAVPHEAIPGWLAALDVAVAPYPADGNAYFSPLKLFEYMAAGRPVVAAAVGQVPQVLRDGVTGLLYPAGDVAALAAALEQLLAEPALGARLGRAARAQAAAHHTWHSVASEVVALAAGIRPAAEGRAA